MQASGHKVKVRLPWEGEVGAPGSGGRNKHVLCLLGGAVSRELSRGPGCGFRGRGGSRVQPRLLGGTLGPRQPHLPNSSRATSSGKPSRSARSGACFGSVPAAACPSLQGRSHACPPVEEPGSGAHGVRCHTPGSQQRLWNVWILQGFPEHPCVGSAPQLEVAEIPEGFLPPFTQPRNDNLP